MRKIAQVLTQFNRAERSAMVDAIDNAQAYTARAKRCVLAPAAATEDVGEYLGYLDDALRQLFAAKRTLESKDPGFRIETLTTKLRSSKDYGWPRLRKLLSQRKVNSRTSLLAEFIAHSQDAASLGVLVTEDRRVFQFVYQYDELGVERGSLSDWQELTAGYPGTEWDEEIQRAFALLDAG